MTLTVEDGSLVTSPDSFISLAAAKTFAATRGLTLNAVDATIEIHLRKAFDYLNSITFFRGSVVSSTQRSAWPRTEAYIHGVLWDKTVIPESIQEAQVHIAAAIEAGLDPAANRKGEKFKIKSKVGPLESEFSESIGTSELPVLRVVDGLLAPYLTVGTGIQTARA